MARFLIKFNPFDNTITKVESVGGAPIYNSLSFDGTYIWVGRSGAPFVILKKFAHLRKWDFIPGVNIIFPVTNVTSDYTAKDTDNTILADASGGNITLSLPTSIGRKGKIFNIKKIDSSANSIIIDPSGTEKIDDNLTYTIGTQYESVTLISDNLNWLII